MRNYVANEVFCYEDIQIYFVRDIIIQIVSSGMLLIYLRIIFLFLTRPTHYSNVFFRFMVLNGIIGICVYVSCLIHKSAFFFAWLEVGNEGYSELRWWKGVLLFVLYASGISGNAAQVCMALNRLSAIILVQEYNQLWKRYFPYVVTFILVLPFAIIPGLLVTPARFYTVCFPDYPWLDYSAVDADFTPWKFWFNPAKVAFSVDCLFVVAGMSINLLTISLFKGRRSSVHFSLVLMCLGDLFVHFCILIDDFVGFIYEHELVEFDTFNTINSLESMFLETILLFPGLWSLVCSKQIRREFFEFPASTPVYVIKS
ncbi:hypothetical protein M3Y96_00519600 [Aphelenchoides besseyi]|nr:hypothetical protein M3Y96_00519600 [Aphelenchoides besseyi]